MRVPRSTVYRAPTKRGPYKQNEALTAIIRKTLEEHPYYGVRKLTWVINRSGKLGTKVNWKAVYRILKLKGWVRNKRAKGHRPRTKASKSATEVSNRRWAIDTTHIPTARGFCHMTAVIDCCDRSILGWRISYSGKASIAGAALEDAFIKRRPGGGLTVRSDNGLVFGAKTFVSVVRKWRAKQEYITPYTPEQNGMIERFFRTLKEECIWLHNFEGLKDAQNTIEKFIEKYNNERPHWSLGFKTPLEVFNQLAA